MSTAHERGARLLSLLAILGLGVVILAVVAQPTPVERTAVAWEDIAPPQTTAVHPWRWIVIHHSGTSAGDTAAIDRGHVADRGWDGIGYHFVIGNGTPMPLGRIDSTWRWRQQRAGAHAGPGELQQPYNDDGIGICLIGVFAADAPNAAQLDRLSELCATLVAHVPTLSVNRIIAHREVPGKATACPGRVDLPRLRYLVRERLSHDNLPVR